MIIKVRVLPNSPKNEIVTRIGSVLRVQLVTKDVDSEETNKMLKKVIAEFFEVKEKDVFIRRGQKGKEKTVELEGKSEEEFRQILDRIP
jgi:uncharacterized protein YggU (UPF0235/DUF167 family)